jgi:hypothetical protein
MVRVLVNHDLITSPVPVRDDVVIVRGDVPVEIVEPEAFPVSTAEPEYMLRSKPAGEASVCPRLIEVEVGIPGATVMSDPLIVRSVNVRDFRMTRPVHGNVILFCGSGLLISCRGWTARGPGRHPDGTASRNVPATNLGTGAAARPLGAPSILRKSYAPSILCKSGDANQQ